MLVKTGTHNVWKNIVNLRVWITWMFNGPKQGRVEPKNNSLWAIIRVDCSQFYTFNIFTIFVSFTVNFHV